ncbi:MAG: AsmA family protein [Bryobacteraceae bacterium]
MSAGVRRVVRWSLVVLAVLAAIVLSAPFVGADRFAAAIHEGLESKLGRTVDLRGEIRFRAFPRLGFTVEDPLGGSAMVIHELRSMGMEPVAYVERLEVSVALGALLRGQMELAGIRLVNPSVNLMKLPGGGWNLQPLIRQALGKGSFPEIAVTGGRLNFKTGDLKSMFYLAETDLVVEADLSDPSRFGIRVEGDPARTDRGTRAFGRLSGRGMLTWPDGSAPGDARLEMSLSVERSAISEIASLAAAKPAPVNGFVASRFRLTGPLKDLGIEGSVELDQVERAVLFARSGSRLALSGKFRLEEGALLLETADSAEAPVSARVEVNALFGQPRPAVSFGLREVPAASLRDLLSEMGYGELGQMPVEGQVSGSFAWSPEAGARGEFTMSEARIGGGPPLGLEGVAIRVADQKVELAPALVRIGREAVTAGAVWNPVTGELEVKLASSGISAAELRRLSADVLRAEPPWVTEWSGIWSGSLTMKRSGGGKPVWTGPLRVAKARAPDAGGMGAVAIDSAQASLRTASWSIRNAEGEVDGTPVRFDYSSDGTLALRLGRVEMGRIAAAMRQLHSMAGKAPVARGTVSVASITGGMGTWRVRGAGIRARFFLQGGQLLFREIAGTVEGAPVSGRMEVSFTRDAPAYSGHAALRGVSWQLGTLDLEGDFEASGADVPGTFRWRGSFAGSDAQLGPGRVWDALAGCFDYSSPGGTPKLALTAMEVETGGAVWLGRGTAAADGRIPIVLSPVGDGEPVRAAGRLGPFRVELGAAAPAALAAGEKSASKQD